MFNARHLYLLMQLSQGVDTINRTAEWFWLQTKGLIDSDSNLTEKGERVIQYAVKKGEEQI